MPSCCRRMQTVAMEAGTGAADESGVGKKSIAHRDFATVCCYLQVLGLAGGKRTG